MSNCKEIEKYVDKNIGTGTDTDRHAHTRGNIENIL